MTFDFMSDENKKKFIDRELDQYIEQQASQVSRKTFDYT